MVVQMTESPDKMTFRQARISKQISRETLAADALMSVSSIVRIERGTPVNRKTFLRACMALGVNPDEIVGVVFSNATRR